MLAPGTVIHGFNLVAGSKGQDLIVADKNTSDVNNEKDYDFYAVVDGHGEKNLAAERVAHCISDECFNGSPGVPTNEEICKGFERLDARIVQQMKAHKIPSSGACIACLFLGEKEAKIAWVGDTRAVVVNQENKIIFVTEDHKIDTNVKERHRINENAKTSMPREGLMESKVWQKAVRVARKEGKILKDKSFIGRRPDHRGVPDPTKPWVLYAHENGVSLQVSRSLGDYLGARSCIPTPEIMTVCFQRVFNDNFSATTSKSNKFVDEGVKIFIGSDAVWSVMKIKEFQKKVKRRWTKTNLNKFCKDIVGTVQKRRKELGHVDDDISLLCIQVIGGAIDHEQTFTFYAGSVGTGSVGRASFLSS